MNDQSLLQANQLRRIAGDSIRLYFAPLVGALRALGMNIAVPSATDERRPTTVPPKGKAKP